MYRHEDRWFELWIGCGTQPAQSCVRLSVFAVEPLSWGTSAFHGAHALLQQAAMLVRAGGDPGRLEQVERALAMLEEPGAALELYVNQEAHLVYVESPRSMLFPGLWAVALRELGLVVCNPRLALAA